jgi:hypothetical protein
LVRKRGVSDSGYYFDSWSGNVETIINVKAANTTVSMNGDFAITARFAPIGVWRDDPEEKKITD